MGKGRLFIISGPSGSGKDTILKQIFKLLPDIRFSISTITRPMRAGEIEGEKYNFTTKEAFEKMIDNDELLEYNVYLDNYYGTPEAPVLEAINGGADIIVEVDVNGAEKIRKRINDAVSIFVIPPSLEVLRSRLKDRATDSDSAVQRRLDCALREIGCAHKYDYVVINDSISDAVADVLEIIKVDRLKADKNTTVINKILNK